MKDNMPTLKDIKDYCIKHTCEDCPIFKGCFRMFGLVSPIKWWDDDIENIEKEIIND